MTYMDDLLFEINPAWHPPTICFIYSKVRSHRAYDFEGKNFLDWSRSNGFEVSAQRGIHWSKHMLPRPIIILPAIDAILHRA
jgi:hypothetical protein